jgi:hypothetical protein
MGEWYIHSPKRLHGVELKELWTIFFMPKALVSHLQLIGTITCVLQYFPCSLPLECPPQVTVRELEGTNRRQETRTVLFNELFRYKKVDRMRSEH